MALVGCHSSRSNDLSVHARIDSTGYIRLLVESSEEDDKKSHAAIFKVKFGKKREKEQSPIRASEKLIRFLMTWSLLHLPLKAVTSTLTEDHFVPTAKCIIQDTKGRQLVPRSGRQRLQCCVCHLHHDQAIKSPWRVRQFFKTVLQQVHHFEVDVIAGDANAAA